MSTGPGISGGRIILKLRETKHRLVDVGQAVEVGEETVTEAVTLQVYPYDEESVAEP